MSDPESAATGGIEWGVITPGLPGGLDFKPNNGELRFTAVYFTRIGDLVTVTGSFTLINGEGNANWSTRISNFPYSPPFPGNTVVAPGSVTCNHFSKPIVGAWICYSSPTSVNLTIYNTPVGTVAGGTGTTMSGTVMFSFVYSITGAGLPAGTAQAIFSEPVED